MGGVILPQYEIKTAKYYYSIKRKIRWQHHH